MTPASANGRLMDFLTHNREAWNQQVEEGNIWTRPVDSLIIEKAKKGMWSVLFSPTKPVPLEWFTKLDGENLMN